MMDGSFMDTEHRERIFGSDRITINGRFTFRKSEIQGIISEHKIPSNTAARYFYLFVLISGNKIKVDETKMHSDTEIYGGIERQLEAYHKKWEENLSNIGSDETEIKKEKVMI